MALSAGLVNPARLEFNRAQAAVGQGVGQIDAPGGCSGTGLGDIFDHFIQRYELQRNLCRTGERLQLVQAGVVQPLMFRLGGDGMADERLVRVGRGLDLGDGLGDDFPHPGRLPDLWSRLGRAFVDYCCSLK